MRISYNLVHFGLTIFGKDKKTKIQKFFFTKIGRVDLDAFFETIPTMVSDFSYDLWFFSKLILYTALVERKSSCMTKYGKRKESTIDQ